jgi:hypothetical protein
MFFYLFCEIQQTTTTCDCGNVDKHICIFLHITIERGLSKSRLYAHY